MPPTNLDLNFFNNWNKNRKYHSGASGSVQLRWLGGGTTTRWLDRDDD